MSGRPSRDPTALPFDQYQRYRLVSDLLTRLRGRGKPLRILDVGGRTAVLREFMDDPVSLVDVETSEVEDLILGSGCALPFQDDSFDAVAAFDTLEHVPPELRADFVAECARVARRWVVLAGPYDAPRVVQAEEMLQAFLADKLGVNHRYLDEHRHYGLPDRTAVEAQLTKLGARVGTIGHANLDRWLVLMCVAFYMDDDPALRGLARTFHEFYNDSLYASDHAEPVYRHLVVGAFGRARLPEVSELLGPPRAPEGAIGAFSELSNELMAFDRERDAWRKERAKLRETIDDLKGDLAGHRETLGEVKTENAEQLATVKALEAELAKARTEHEAVVETFERDLGEHDKTVEELRTELATQQEDLEGIRTALEADLKEHEGMVAELERDLAASRAGLEEQRVAFETDLAEHKKTLAEHEKALGEHKETRAELEAELAAHRELETVLRGEVAERERAYEALDETRTGEIDAHKAEAGRLAGELSRVQDGARALEEALRVANEAAEGLNETLVSREAALHESRTEVGSQRDEIDRLHGEVDRLQRDIALLRVELRDRWKNMKRALHWKKPEF